MKYTIRLFSDIYTEFSNHELTKKVRETYLFLPTYGHYENEYSNHSYQNLSFIITIDQKLSLALCCTQKDNSISFFNSPATLFLNDNLTIHEKEECAQIVDSHFSKIITQYSINNIFIFENPILFSGSRLLQETESIIDLSNEIDTILRDVRKSYRSLINWGLKNIRFETITPSNPKHELFFEFKNFHIQVAGRETRSHKTWEILYQMLCEGNGYLVLGYQNDKLATGALVLHGDAEAYYSVAVNDRTEMETNKPLGHATILRCIEHAKDIGLKRFNLGVINSERHELSPKEKNIALFKKGFTSNVRTKCIDWISTT